MAETPDCPCGAKLSDEEKSTINWGRSNSVFQNPVASQINNAQGGFASGLEKAQQISGILGALGGSNGQINTLINSIGNMQGALTSYSNMSALLSGTGGSGNFDLLSLVSTVGAAVNFQCALGIEGLDVGLGIGLVTEDGKLRLNTAINVQADLNKILGNIDTGGLVTDVQNAIGNAAAEISKITDQMNSIAGEINTSIAAVNGLFNDALDFVSQFTNINFAMNFSNDPCTKFGVGFQQGILNPEFIERARAANPLNRAVSPGFGTTTR
jgi:hypothetical protein